MTNVDTLRLVMFFLVLLLLAVLEYVIPKRNSTLQKITRWPANLGLSVINSLILKLILPGGLALIAVFSEKNNYGLLNQIQSNTTLEIIIGLIILDLVIYFQHRLFHAIPLLWRLHRVHHSDRDFDVTTAIRFHPVEILLSLCIKMAVVFIFGIDALTIVIFEIILSTCALFNHSNIRIPLFLDKWLRLLIVTPDMHRVHHSIYVDETNSNYGFNLPWWDRLFRTYQDQPRDGHSTMVIGLSDQQRHLSLKNLFLLTFK